MPMIKKRFSNYKKFSQVETIKELTLKIGREEENPVEVAEA